MNNDLHLMFEADKREHSNVPEYGTPAYKAMRERDRQRRLQVAQIIAAGDAQTAEDYYHAARIYQHGDIPEDAWNAYTLARQAADLGHQLARWLSAAAYDRWLMYEGKPQKYGTQYVSDGIRQRLWDVDPTTTDAERAVWDVPPLAEQLFKAEEATRNHPPLPVGDDAPWWLKEAIQRWRTADNADETAP